MAFIGNNPKSKTNTLTPQSADPANAADGMLYVSDGTAREKGLWRYDSSASAWVKVGSGLNTDVVYIDDNFESGVSSWATYNDTAGTAPVDGTGGSANITFTSNTSSPLRGSADGLITKDAANRQGQGISRSFTLNNTDQAKVLTISFDYKTSTNFVDNDIAVFVYDITNSALIRVVPQDVKATSLTNRFLGSFQSAPNSTSYRVILHIASTNASAYTVNIDNFKIEPLSVTSNQLVAFSAYRSGNYTATAAAFTALDLTTVETDTAAGVSTASDNYTTPESGYYVFSGRVAFQNVQSTDAISLLIRNTTASSDIVLWGTQQPLTGATGDVYYEINSKPVYLAKGVSVQLQYLITNARTIIGSAANSYFSGYKIPSPTTSEFSSGNVVAFSAAGNGGTALTANVTNIDFTKITDTTNSWSGSVFTVPESGYYEFSGSVRYTATTSGDLMLYVDGSSNKRLAVGSGAQEYKFSFGGSFNKGQTVALRDSSSDTLSNSTSFHYIQGFKVPTAGASGNAGELVAAIYTSNSGATIGTGPTDMVYEDIVYDSHAAYNTSTGIYTAPVSGLYEVTGMWGSSVSSGTMRTSIYVAGSEVAIKFTQANSSANSSADITGLVSLTKGQALKIVVQNPSSAALFNNGIYNRLSIRLVK